MVDVSPWHGLVLGDEIADGNRNRVWRAAIEDHAVAVRQSRRSAESLSWELDLIDFLDRHDFIVPTVIATDDGRDHVDGLVVQRWVDGREPTTDNDWRDIATELQRLHAVTVDYPQRPGCCAVTELEVERRSGDADLDRMDPAAAELVLAVFADFAGTSLAVVHGDVWAPNLRITSSGRVGLLDWDESRVDIVDHDLSPLAIQVLDDNRHRAAQRLSHAWEAANGWIVEPDYARGRLAALQA